MTRKKKPKIGESYIDAIGRKLTVTDVKVNDRLGREVIGKISGIKVNGRRTRKRFNYSTTLEMWRETWRDKVEPISVGRMKIG